MPGKAYATTNHAVIRNWVESRDGIPTVVSTTKSPSSGGIIRIAFPEHGENDALEKIGWERFFTIFEGKNLAFLYQKTTEDGEESRFCKIVYRSTVEELLEESRQNVDYRTHSTEAHEKIKRWAEVRGGRPSVVSETKDGSGGGLLRIEFPTHSDTEALEPINWDTFFDVFDEKDLVFVYQEQTKDGGESRFCRFVAAE